MGDPGQDIHATLAVGAVAKRGAVDEHRADERALRLERQSKQRGHAKQPLQRARKRQVSAFARRYRLKGFNERITERIDAFVERQCAELLLRFRGKPPGRALDERPRRRSPTR